MKKSSRWQKSSDIWGYHLRVWCTSTQSWPPSCLREFFQLLAIGSWCSQGMQWIRIWMKTTSCTWNGCIRPIRDGLRLWAHPGPGIWTPLWILPQNYEIYLNCWGDVGQKILCNGLWQIFDIESNFISHLSNRVLHAYSLLFLKYSKV